MATPAAIGSSVHAAVLLGNNVLDVKHSGLNGGVRETAILTPAPGPFADALAKRLLHRPFEARFRKARAFAWRMAMKSMAAT